LCAIFRFMNRLPSWFGVSKHRRIAKVLLGLVFLAPIAAGTTFAQERGLADLATGLSGTLQQEQLRTVIVSDFLGKGDRVTLQGVLLADKLWFALLEQEKGFHTFDRSLLQKRLYSESYRKAEVDSAHAFGADVLITGSIVEQPKDLNISITAWNVSSGGTLKVLTAAVPRTQSLDELSVQSIQPNGPIYLVSQSGVSMPTCIYCPYPQYSDEARKREEC
jgi:hypothetical protein